MLEVKRSELVALLTAFEELADSMAGEYGSSYSTHEQTIQWAFGDHNVLAAYASLRALVDAQSQG